MSKMIPYPGLRLLLILFTFASHNKSLFLRTGISQCYY